MQVRVLPKAPFIMTLQDKNLQEDINLILDTFTGADGGVSFMAFQMIVRDLDSKKEFKDKTMLKVVTDFAKFLRGSKMIMLPKL